jgi:hypothetical protein
MWTLQTLEPLCVTLSRHPLLSEPPHTTLRAQFANPWFQSDGASPCLLNANTPEYRTHATSEV